MPFSASDLPPLLRRLIQPSATTAGADQISQEMLKAGDAGGDLEAGDFIGAISLDEAVEVYSAVRALGPDDSAEIGFCCAGSGLAILKGLEDQGRGMHHACDPFQSSYAKNAGLRNVQKAGLAHRLHFQEKFPEEAFPPLPALQFIFIDASHLFDLSVLDFVLADKKLEVGGVLAFHDLWMPSLQKLVRYILTNRSYEIYRPTPPPPAPRSLRSSVKNLIAAGLSRLPRADRVFSRDLLMPWSRFELGNMAFLRKIGADTRDWRHHQPF